MGHLQFRSGEGIRYPRSGELVGRVAELLRIKGYLRDGWAASYKTAQRYFSGEPINETKDLVRTLVEALVPEGFALPAVVTEPEADVRHWMSDVLCDALRRWDFFVGRMNGGSFPLVDHDLAPVPLLRLLVLDVGVRCAAYLVLMGAEPPGASPWLEHDCLGRAIDALRRNDLTLAKLAEKAEVSDNTLNAWRTGASVPTDANLAALTDALGGEPAAALRLRIAAGITATRKHLAMLCGSERIDDLVAAMLTTIRVAHRILKFAPIPDEVRTARLRELVLEGARATAGERLVQLLAESSPLNQEVQADFAALGGDWQERLSYWAHTIAIVRRAAPEMAKHMNIPLHEAERLAPAVEQMVLQMRDYDRVPDPKMQLVVVKGDAFTSAMNRIVQADRAMSTGDLVGAIAHTRRAVELQPENAEMRFFLGARLGRLMAHGDRACLEEALEQCRTSVRLAPTWDKPRTEIGVILSNAGRLEEAEAAFREAEPLAEDVAHFHFARGNNFVWLRDLASAAESFAVSARLEPGFLEPRIHLAAVCAHLGRADELKRVAAEIKRLGGPIAATLDAWKSFLPGQCWVRAPRRP